MQYPLKIKEYEPHLYLPPQRHFIPLPPATPPPLPPTRFINRLTFTFKFRQSERRSECQVGARTFTGNDTQGPSS